LTGPTEDEKRELLRRLLQERIAKQRDLKDQKSSAAPAREEGEPALLPAPRDGELELSFGQEMVWLLEQIVPEAMFYNIVERFGITGALDVALLRRCIDEVVKRHEVLRTVYPVVAGQPVQRIEPPAPSDLRVFDFRQFPALERDEETRRLIIAEAKTRFDLAKGPLFRPLLLQVGDENYIFAVVIHHIAIDGWSLWLFINEIAALYGAFSEGRPPDLAPINIQYADFARWQRRSLTDARLTSDRDYWRKTLGAIPPALKLRTDYTAGKIRTFESATYQASISADVVERLREIGRREGATLFAVLLAGFAAFLMRCTGQEDFVIGSIISSRARPELEHLLGFFINSLALRTDMSGNPTFSALVERTRKIVFAAQEHGAFPFHRLAEVIQPDRSANHSNPFAQVFLNMLNLWDRQEVSLPNLSIRPLGGLDLHNPVDLLSLYASVNSNQLDLTFSYSSEFFKPATIEQMAEDLCQLLSAAAFSPEIRILDLPMSMQQMGASAEAVREILADLKALGVRLSIEDGRLKVNAPKGVLSDTLKTAIAAHREDIVARVQADSSRGDIHDGMFERQRSYWKAKLAGIAPVLALPSDRPRPAQRSLRNGRVDCKIEAEMVQRLQQLSERHDATLFMTILAAFSIVLHRLSTQDDIVIGAPIANPRAVELEEVIGLSANNLPLRLNFAGDPSFATYLAQVRDTTIEAVDNCDLPFEAVVEAVKPEPALDHAPIYQVMFGLDHLSMPTPGFEGPNNSFVDRETQAAPLDLQLSMTVREGQLDGTYEYGTDLFDQTTIERLHAQLTQTLLGVLEDDGMSVRNLPIRSAAEDRVLLDVWNNTAIEHDRSVCVHQLFERTAARKPEATAFIIGEQAFSYRDIDQRANQLARLLQLRGVRRGDRVGVCVDRSVEMPIAIAAVLKAGAAYVPMDPAHPADRLRYIVEDAQVACVVTLSRLGELFDATEAPKVLLDITTSERDALETSAPAVSVAPEDVAYVIYTSGSTGRPKGVQVEHRNVVSFLRAMQREPGLVEADVLLAVTTLSFDIAGLELWLPLSVGATIILASKGDVLDGTRLIDLVDRHKATVMQATPSTWRLLLDAGWRGKSDLRALCGGEAMPIDLAAALVNKIAKLWNMYGPTETTIWSTTSLVVETSGVPTIGRPIANTRVYVLEPSGTLAALGGFGELAIGGEGVARGYWNRPELTAEKFLNISLPGGRSERIYRTGDIVRLRNDGQLEFHGRRDHQIKLRGYRIELGEIEAILATCEAVKEAVVIVREDAPGDQRLVAYVVVRDGETFEPEAARTVLKASLPAYMVPAELVVLTTMPLTPNGKVNRADLPAPQHGNVPLPHAGPEIVMSPVQRRVANLWTEVLRADNISLHDNFFDVGGHSMLVAKLHAAIKREFESDVTLTELFQHTTIAAQASRVSMSAGGDVAGPRAAARVSERLDADQIVASCRGPQGPGGRLDPLDDGDPQCPEAVAATHLRNQVRSIRPV
jgi:amino acid adenylation domain-containing protein